ncbi:MAG: efflux RND transporter periplasmic adaptor subunit [Tannerella sp.]|jgi:cobalt-zinc-cadmium efflux system membrane fusion protein|nr:efflux RND transporter periplasmic adaptor subunit [Tannerella sp.]
MDYKNISKFFTALFILISLFSCKNKNQANEESEADSSLVRISKAQFDHINMQTGALQKVEFNDEIKVRGMTDVPPQSKATVSPVVSGSVKAIFVHPGDRVKKGQPLLRFEGQEIIGLQQSYMEISGQLKSLEAEYKRQQTLFSENVSSEKLFLEAESNYKKALAAGEGLKQQLLLLNMNTDEIKQGKISPSAVIYAPIDGDIVRINADISKYIQPSDVVIEMVDTRQLQLYLPVFEKDIVSIRTGQKVVFSLPESSDQSFEATVTIVGKAIDRTDRTAIVQALPHENIQSTLLTGMYINAGIVIASKTVWALPMDAIIAEEGEYYVLLLQSSDDNEYVFRKTKVQTGDRNGDIMEFIPDEAVTSSSVILIKGTFNAL